MSVDFESFHPYPAGIDKSVRNKSKGKKCCQTESNFIERRISRRAGKKLKDDFKKIKGNVKEEKQKDESHSEIAGISNKTSQSFQMAAFHNAYQHRGENQQEK